MSGFGDTQDGGISIDLPDSGVSQLPSCNRVCNQDKSNPVCGVCPSSSEYGAIEACRPRLDSYGTIQTSTMSESFTTANCSGHLSIIYQRDSSGNVVDMSVDFGHHDNDSTDELVFDFEFDPGFMPPPNTAVPTESGSRIQVRRGSYSYDSAKSQGTVMLQYQNTSALSPLSIEVTDGADFHLTLNTYWPW